MTCKARQYSDQMICDRCALQWGVNDLDKPDCLTVTEFRVKKCRELKDKVRKHNRD